MKRMSLLALLMLLSAAAAFAQDAPRLNTSAAAGKATVDGTVNVNEYANRADIGRMSVYYTQNADGTLSLAAVAPTSGWVSVGLGSARMDGAHMLFGFINNGVTSFEEHLGRGWTHRKTDRSVVTEHKMSLVNNVVTLEATVPLSAAKIGDNSFIAAFGPAANFTAYHTGRGSAKFTLR